MPNVERLICWMPLPTILLLMLFLLPAKGQGMLGQPYGQQHYGDSNPNSVYVQPDSGYHRSAPNHTDADNWSTRGSVNPYTGAVGTKDAKGELPDQSPLH
jgi:hypothetical protein